LAQVYSDILRDKKTAERVKVRKPLLGEKVSWGDFRVIFYTVGEILMVWGLLYVMYKKNIFLRV